MSGAMGRQQQHAGSASDGIPPTGHKMSLCLVLTGDAQRAETVTHSRKAEASAGCEVCEGAEGMTEPLKQCMAWLRAYFCEPARMEQLPVPPFHHPLLQQGVPAVSRPDLLGGSGLSLGSLLPSEYDHLQYRSLILARASSIINLSSQNSPLTVLLGSVEVINEAGTAPLPRGQRGPAEALGATRSTQSSPARDSFTRQVLWTLLRDVKFGEAISYQKLADLAGNSRAARAVGGAMRSNPE
ncbi:Methylated-DNA--protein-cysteine methyltransferase [Aix galericulata]|nr:Methylated-DNA--protein-cysteine methyltransferase [Aix galericulata]